MKYLFKIREDSFFKRRKIRKDFRHILEEEGFIRHPRTLRHPFTESYTSGGYITAKIYPSIEEHGFEPYRYKAIELEMDGLPPEDPIFKRTRERLNAYLNEIKKKMIEESNLGLK